MKCPNPKCGKETPAWQSSGMSDSCPHFFCDTCSNVIHREQDHALLYENEINQELLDRIAATLPDCPCGGRFVPGANPKCPSCKTEYVHQWDAVKRLNVPFMPILDGSCLIRDRLYSYEVCIGLNQNPNKIHATNALLQRNNLKNTTSIESDFFVIFIQTSSLSLQLYC